MIDVIIIFFSHYCIMLKYVHLVIFEVSSYISRMKRKGPNKKKKKFILKT